jgi:CSLREA domain-containing protein
MIHLQRSLSRLTLPVLLGFCLAVGTWSLQPASAAPLSAIAVNTLDDELNADGDCSLREAIQAANMDAAVDACQAGSGNDTVNLLEGTYLLTIPGSEEDGNRPAT